MVVEVEESLDGDAGRLLETDALKTTSKERAPRTELDDVQSGKRRLLIYERI